MCRVLILAKSKSKSTGTRVGLSFEAIISSIGGFQGLIHLNGLGNVSARSPATAPAESGKGGNLTNTSRCLCSEVARVFYRFQAAKLCWTYLLFTGTRTCGKTLRYVTFIAGRGGDL